MSSLPSLPTVEPGCSFDVTETPSEMDRTIQVLLENETLTLPHELTTAEVFYHVISSNTFENLSENNKAKLKSLLPANVNDNELRPFLDHLFDPNNQIGFLNPVKIFFENLQAGHYDSEFVSKFSDLKECLKLQYKIRLRDYYAKLLKDLLIRRRKLIESALKCAKDDKIHSSFHGVKIDRRKEKLKLRSLKRAKIMLNNVKSHVGEHNHLSSDDEDIASLPKDPQIYLTSKHPSTSAATVANEEQHFSTLSNPRFQDLELHQPSQMSEIKTLLAEFKMLRKLDPDHPSLEFSDITLEDVVERTGLPQQPTKQPVKKIAAVLQPQPGNANATK